MYKTPHRSFMEKELKSKCLKILYAPKTIKEAILMVLKEEGGNGGVGYGSSHLSN